MCMIGEITHSYCLHLVIGYEGEYKLEYVFTYSEQSSESFRKLMVKVIYLQEF